MVLCTATLSGCTMTDYLLHAAAGEAKILLSRRSVDESLKKSSFGPEKREKLTWILQTAEAAESVLGLARDKQYREVAHLSDDFNVWVLALAEPDRLEQVTWSFPIVGEVPYLGFFSRKKAEKMADSHYPEKDRYLRTAAAFSTLGFFPDPILPAFFKLDKARIVNVVVHELVHATLYLPSQSNWNETIATALGDAGTVVLLKHWDQPELLAEATRRFADRKQWADLLADTLTTMRQEYQAVTSSEARLALKEQHIDRFKTQISEATWHEAGYARYADFPINHAFLLANEVYLTNQTYQSAVYAAAVSDFAGTLAWLKCWIDRKPDDPWQLPGEMACDP